MASPPFNIAETVPGDSDIVSQFPAVERTFRDIVEDWISVEHNTYGFHKIPTHSTATRDAETNWSIGGLIYNSTVKQLQYTLSIDPDVWYSEGVPTGTRAPFQQSSAPTGWTKESNASYNEAVITGTTGNVGTAGSVSSETLFARTGTDAVTLVAGNIPTLTAGNFAWAGTAAAHTHTGTTNDDGGHDHANVKPNDDAGATAGGVNFWRNSTQGDITNDGEHTHDFTTDSSGPHTVTMSSMSYTNSSQTTFTPAIDCRVKRFSCIIATKD